MSFTLSLPLRTGDQTGEEEIHFEHNSFVILGANGAGKSRLGEWLDRRHYQKEDKVHRISAQRALHIPATIQYMPVGKAANYLFMGIDPNAPRSRFKYTDKLTRRFQGDPFTTILNDFDKVLMLLLARRMERNENYTILSQQQLQNNPPPPSPDERLIELWNRVFPHRELAFDFKNGTIEAKFTAGIDPVLYPAAQMSDGEKVALYLMATCLCVPEGKIIIIDEPDIHLHKSVLARLWNELENTRPDCLFVYITHDLDFAASRREAKKIVIKRYNGNQMWEWIEIPSIQGVPEEVLYNILGSRTGVILVEGKLDVALYSLIYSSYLIISLGSCEKVIEVAASLSSIPNLHHMEVYGIIDRDFRTDEELENLEKIGVHAIEVAEVENLLFVPHLIKFIAHRSGLNEEKAFLEVVNRVFNLMQGDLEAQISKRTSLEIEQLLRTSFDAKQKGEQNIKLAFQNLSASIDVGGIWKKNQELYENIVISRNYELALRVFNHKGIVQAVNSVLQWGDYLNRVLNILRVEAQMVDELRKYVPKLK